MNLVRRRVVRVVLDTALLIGFLAEFTTREGPDYAVHSWIGVALIPAISVHLVSNWRWVTSTMRRRQAHPDWGLARFNAVFAVVAAVCIATGFPLWLDWSQAGVLVTGHTVTGLASVVLALSHLWQNRERALRLLRRPAVSS